MEGAITISCSGCGSTNVIYDPKTRSLTCQQCGKRETYSRATLKRNNGVVHCKGNALRLFKEANYADARKFAFDILNIMEDNVPARFIMRFADEVAGRQAGSLKHFFDDMADEAMEFDEVRDLIELMTVGCTYLADYEEDIIKLFAANMQSPNDKAELCEFIDTVCPFFIRKRRTVTFMSPALTEMYGDLTEHCGIPKTCLALIKGIETNPESPYAPGGSFDMKARVKGFYEDYVLRVGEVIKRMNAPQWKAKFESGYQQKLKKFQEDSGLS